MRPGPSVLRLVTVLLAAAEAVGAQQEPKPRDLPDAPAPKQEQAPSEHGRPLQTTFEILGRRSIFFPDLATSRGPLSTSQKLELSADKSIAPSSLVTSAIGAGIRQARNSLPGYGQGMGGYGKRFGASMATGASAEFFGTFLLSSLLHRDPRFFVKLQGGPVRRIGYALSRLVVARTDEGTEAANWPGILGPLLAESMANSYLPAEEQTAGRTFQRYGVSFGLTASANIFKEYWPDIFRSLRIRKIAPRLGPDSSAVALPSRSSSASP